MDIAIHRHCLETMEALRSGGAFEAGSPLAGAVAVLEDCWGRGDCPAKAACGAALTALAVPADTVDE